MQSSEKNMAQEITHETHDEKTQASVPSFRRVG